MLSSPRINRLFAADGKCFNLALDHGFFNEFDLLAGVEDMPATVNTAIDAAPDAIQLTCGQAQLLAGVCRRSRMPLVIRLDTTNVYRPDRAAYQFTQMIESPVERALRLDAACVILNLFSMPDG